MRSKIQDVGLTGTTFRTEVSEHCDSFLALLDFALLHSLNKGVFGIERPRLPSKFQSLFPGNFSDCATRGKVTLQDPIPTNQTLVR